MSQDIDERTRVPLFAMAVILPALALTVLYVSTIAWTAADARSVNERQDAQIKENVRAIVTNKDDVMIYLIEIDKRTIRIEEYLKHKEK